MDKEELQRRTKLFALRVMKLVASLPKEPVALEIGHQLVKSGTSVGANYLEACHGTSRADFVAKLKICEREAIETRYWIELLIEGGVVTERLLHDLLDEAMQLAAIMAAAARTSRGAR